MGLRFLGWATWNWRYELLIDVVYYYSIIKLVYSFDLIYCYLQYYW